MVDAIKPRSPYFDDSRPDRRPSLKRSLGFWPLTFYGLGTIIGAGIYVLVGEVAGRAGMAAPFAFVAAGIVAGLTGFSYAELVARHPEAAGETAYVEEAFGSKALARIAGVALIFVAIIAAASIAKGAAGYLQQYVALPRWAGGAIVVTLFTIVAAVGVTESVRVAVALTIIEIGGLMLIVVLAGPALEALPARAGELIPGDLGGWAGVFAGMFVAFFAFIGFDTLANMAEETEEVARTLPRAILAAVAISSLLYGIVALVSVFALSPADLSAHDAPLVAVLETTGFAYSRHFAAIALIATANGVMVEIVLVARLAYGMARRHLLPAWFSAVNARTRTPLRATLIGGTMVLGLVVAVPFSALVSATSTVTLAVFTLVNLSLMRLQMKAPRPDLAIRAPRWAPPMGALTCVGLIAAQLAD
ncbi:MAG: APC family permease [Alphaproteobacteria bacterium]|nr:APC family permease [Alphaproteobacteria bacterium]